MFWRARAAALVGAAFLSTAVFDVAVAGAGAEDQRTSVDPDFERFVIDKRALVKRLSDQYQITIPSTVRNFFDAAQRGDWQTSSNLFSQVAAPEGEYGHKLGFPDSLWIPVHETYGAYEQFHLWNSGLLHRFGDHIIKRIPAGSIYFGGTDAGRFVVSALCASQTDGRPFFTVTQNALVDGLYLDYLREIYGTNIYVPTLDDSQKTFASYVTRAEERQAKNQLKEGESVEHVGNRVQVSGFAAVMSINEMLAKVMIDRNPAREIYLEESSAMESLYGQSVPHGLIFKVNHQPLDRLPQGVVDADRKFWTDECRVLIGKAVESATNVSALCSWAERVIRSSGAGDFDGDPVFVKDSQASQYFSQRRSGIACYYEWWSAKSGPDQSTALSREADLAHRQAVSLSPYNPVVAWRYTEYLLRNRRTNDATLLVNMVLKVDPEKRMDVDSDQLKMSLKKLREEAKRLSLEGNTR